MNLIRIKKILTRLSALFLLLLFSISTLLSISSIQTKLGDYTTVFLQKKFDVSISVKKIDLSYLGQIYMKGILIKDHHKDTLISVSKLKTSLLSLNKIFKNKIDLGEVYLYDGVFNLTTYEGDRRDNFAVFIAKLGKKRRSKNRPFCLETDKINLHGVDFTILKFNREKDSLDAYYKKINGTIIDFRLQGVDVYAKLRKMQFVDHHNLEIKNLTTDFSYTDSQMRFKQTHLETKNSNVYAEIAFDYIKSDLKNFSDKVKIKAFFSDTSVSVFDLKKLYNEFGGNDVFHFSTEFNGTLNDFKLKRMNLISNQNLEIKGNYHFKNSIKGGYLFSMDGDIDKIVSKYTHVKGLLPNLVGNNLPSEFDKLGNFTIKGYALITKKKIELNTLVYSDVGNADSALILKNIDNIDEIYYEGNIKITDFKLGEIIENPLLGNMSLEGYVKGKGFKKDSMQTSVKGEITKHQYKGYTYSNIKIDGNFHNRHFDINLNVNDENIKLDLKGMAYFKPTANKFDIKTHIDFANFNKLNLFKRDSIATLKGDIIMSLKGNTIDDIEGKIEFKNSVYINQKSTYKFKYFKIESNLSKGIKTINISSKDIVNGQIRGVFNLTEIDKLVRNSMGSMLTNYTPIKVAENQFFDFDFQIYNESIEVFFPKVRLAKNTLLKGKVVDENNEIKLLFKSSKMGIDKTLLDSIYLYIDNKNPISNINFTIKKAKFPKYVLNEISLLSKTLNDTLFFRTDFIGGKENKERFDLSFYYIFDTIKNSILGIQKSRIHFKDKDWHINPTNNKKNKLVFNLEKQFYRFQKFDFSTGNQQIKFKGVIKDSTLKNLKIKFKKVSLNDIIPKIDSLSMEGLLNGAFNFIEEKGIYKPFGNLNIKKLKINKDHQGNLKMVMKGEESYKKYDVDLKLVDNYNKKLNAKGYIDFTKKPSVHLKVNLNDFNLKAISPLGKNIISNIRGVVNGDFELIGNLYNPNIYGQLKLSETGLTFPYLNVDYNFVENTTVKLYDKSFLFENMILKDSKYKTEGILSGSISHNEIKNWELDLKIKSSKLLALNTKYKEISSYYGTSFVAGEASFIGPTNNLAIDVKANSLADTKFTIPLNYVKTVKNSELVHFKEKKEETTIAPFFDREFLLEKIQGLSLRLELDITKETKIIINQISGSYLKGKGNLLMEIDTKGKFNIYGDYLINSGIYNLVYGGIINKPFKVKKGGVISWSGDPYEADLNIEAIHSVKANPKVILENLNTNRKIDVDLITKVKGKLSNSTEEFHIIIPNSSSLVTSELDFKLNDNDDNTKMRQFFSLLISKNFFNENNIVATGNSAITGTTSDIISSALSDIIDKDGDKFEIYLDYSAGQKNNLETLNTDSQVDISLATQINDRILINGNLGIPVGAKPQSNIAGEVKVEILVDKEGNLRWNFFNRQNEIQYSQEEEGYTQGFGTSYQIDFNNLSEVLSKLRLKKK